MTSGCKCVCWSWRKSLTPAHLGRRDNPYSCSSPDFMLGHRSDHGSQVNMSVKRNDCNLHPLWESHIYIKRTSPTLEMVLNPFPAARFWCLPSRVQCVHRHLVHRTRCWCVTLSRGWMIAIDVVVWILVAKSCCVDIFTSILSNPAAVAGYFQGGRCKLVLCSFAHPNVYGNYFLSISNVSLIFATCQVLPQTSKPRDKVTGWMSFSLSSMIPLRYPLSF